MTVDGVAKSIVNLAPATKEDPVNVKFSLLSTSFLVLSAIPLGPMPLAVVPSWTGRRCSRAFPAWTVMVDECGANVVSQAIVLMAGDMTGCSDELQGVKSDTAPDIPWLRESVVADQQFTWHNPASGLPCLLPHGAGLQASMTEAAVATAVTVSASPQGSSTADPTAERSP